MIEGVEKRESPHAAGENVNWYRLYKKQNKTVWRYSG